jgi:hypothetical protein
MVAHEAEGVNLPIGFGAGLAESFQKPFPVGVIAEDGFTAVTAIHHMVNRAFKFDA